MINHTHRNENKRLGERRQRQWCASHSRRIQIFESSTFCGETSGAYQSGVGQYEMRILSFCKQVLLIKTILKMLRISQRIFIYIFVYGKVFDAKTIFSGCSRPIDKIVTLAQIFSELLLIRVKYRFQKYYAPYLHYGTAANHRSINTRLCRSFAVAPSIVLVFSDPISLHRPSRIQC